MDDSELRLECLKMANAGLRDAGRPDKEPFEVAERLYSWIRHGKQKPQEPIAKCVGRDGNLEPEFAGILSGYNDMPDEEFAKLYYKAIGEPSVGNEPMKETHVTAAFKPFTDYKPE